MQSSIQCPVLELLPEFARSHDRFWSLNDAAAEPGLSEKQASRLRAAEERAQERMKALEGLIMTSIARSELGRTLQIIIGHAEIVTLHSWAIHGEADGGSADEAEQRLSGLFESLMYGRDLSGIPASIRASFLGRSYGEDWIAEAAFQVAPTARAPFARPDMLSAS